MRGKLPDHSSMRPTFFAFALAAVAVIPAALEAQRVLGPTLDATTLRRGTLRTMILSENILLRGRWNDGTAEPLGAGLSVNIGPDENFVLGSIRNLLTNLGVVGVAPSLGATRVDLRQRLAITRLGFDYGVSDRVMLRVQAPFVRVRAEGQLRLDGSSASAGSNPILDGSGVPASNRAVVDAYTNAVNSLTTRRDDCAVNAAAHPECGTINAEAAQVNAAIARGTQFAAALRTIYGAQGLGNGLPYVPMSGSAVEAAFASVGDALRGDFTRWGVTDVSASTGLPLGAQVPISQAELEALLAADFAAQPIERSTRQDLGDIDIGLTINVFDTFAGDAARLAAGRFGIRQSLAFTYRLGGGNFDIPDDFIDLGTGSGHDAIALHSITDVILSERWWASVGLGWARGAEHERVIRVPRITGVDLIPAASQPVRITPADMLELRVAPRWNINDYFGIGAEWRYRSRGNDDLVFLNSVDALPSPPPPTLNYGDAAMNTPSNSNEQRWAWTLSYSTLAAESRGKAGLPIEIGYTHEQSVGSSRGVVPRRWEDRIQIRYYTRLFGR